MVNVKSNIDSVLKSFTDKTTKLQYVLNNISQLMAKKIIEDMQEEIELSRFDWEEPNTNMGDIGMIDFDIIHIDKNAYRIEIGNNLPKITMHDGTMVNPTYFIEFGYGIIGKDFPHPSHSKYDWEYNIKGHTDWWYFKGTDGHTEKSMGNIGTYFMYDTIMKYKKNWKNYLSQLIMESSNV